MCLCNVSQFAGSEGFAGDTGVGAGAAVENTGVVSPIEVDAVIDTSGPVIVG